jgi:hypothetical protein
VSLSSLVSFATNLIVFQAAMQCASRRHPGWDDGSFSIPGDDVPFLKSEIIKFACCGCSCGGITIFPFLLFRFFYACKYAMHAAIIEMPRLSLYSPPFGLPFFFNIIGSSPASSFKKKLP